MIPNRLGLRIPRPEESPWPFGDLVPLSYDVIVLDLPTEFETWSEKGELKSPQHHYDVMEDADMLALPVGRLAQRDCMILMWATAPKLNFCIRALEGYGFEYKSFFVWRKMTVNKKVRMGPGYIVRTKVEPVLIGTIGKPRLRHAFDGCLDGLARQHSRKPEEFYAEVERCTTGLRRADLFGRQSRENWDVWGNEATKFDAALA